MFFASWCIWLLDLDDVWCNQTNPIKAKFLNHYNDHPPNKHIQKKHAKIVLCRVASQKIKKILFKLILLCLLRLLVLQQVLSTAHFALSKANKWDPQQAVHIETPMRPPCYKACEIILQNKFSGLIYFLYNIWPILLAGTAPYCRIPCRTMTICRYIYILNSKFQKMQGRINASVSWMPPA